MNWLFPWNEHRSIPACAPLFNLHKYCVEDNCCTFTEVQPVAFIHRTTQCKRDAVIDEVAEHSDM